MRTIIGAAAVTVALAGQAAGQCDSPDNITSVSGTEHCLQIRTYAPSGGSSTTLVVVLHGALSRGGDVDYIKPAARMAAREYGAVGVVMAQPGYTLEGRTSTGTAERDTPAWYRYGAKKIDSIGAAVATLKKHHGAERLVMVGHSLGAIVSGVTLGRRAPLVDAVVLLGCPCDIPAMMIHHNLDQIPNALSPIDFLSSAPKSARIIALTGDRDRSTPPFVAEDYVEKARKIGLDATFSLVEGVGHNLGRGWRGPVEKALDRTIN